VELVEQLLFDAEATRGASTSWIKAEFGARRPVNIAIYCMRLVIADIESFLCKRCNATGVALDRHGWRRCVTQCVQLDAG